MHYKGYYKDLSSDFIAVLFLITTYLYLDEGITLHKLLFVGSIYFFIATVLYLKEHPPVWYCRIKWGADNPLMPVRNFLRVIPRCSVYSGRLWGR